MICSAHKNVYQSNCVQCFEDLMSTHAKELAELTEWRSGKRRNVWRVRKPGSVEDFDNKRDAWSAWQEGFHFFVGGESNDKACGVYRVTVRPKGKP